jgi:hypothetical protein
MARQQDDVMDGLRRKFKRQLRCFPREFKRQMTGFGGVPFTSSAAARARRSPGRSLARDSEHDDMGDNRRDRSRTRTFVGMAVPGTGPTGDNTC